MYWNKVLILLSFLPEFVHRYSAACASWNLDHLHLDIIRTISFDEKANDVFIVFFWHFPDCISSRIPSAYSTIKHLYCSMPAGLQSN